MRRMRRRPTPSTSRPRTTRRPRRLPTSSSPSSSSNGRAVQRSDGNQRRSLGSRLSKWFDPNTDATGRFIVSIFRNDMRQAGRDIVDIMGELLDKR